MSVKDVLEQVRRAKSEGEQYMDSLAMLVMAAEEGSLLREAARSMGLDLQRHIHRLEQIEVHLEQRSER